jgi:hypothetical protein
MTPVFVDAHDRKNSSPFAISEEITRIGFVEIIPGI